MSRASVETYQKIASEGLLSERRLQTFYSLMYGERARLKETTGLTHNEVAKIAMEHWKFPANYRHNFVARLCELESMSMIRRVLDEHTCPISGETCTTWETVDTTPRALTRKTRATRNELIDALCAQLEIVLPKVKGASDEGKAWLIKVTALISECSRYRKHTKENMQ